MEASAIIADVLTQCAGDPVFLAGSLVAEDTYGLSNAHADVDLFCPTPQVLMSQGQKLISSGYKLDERMARVWFRWLRFGFNHWHTNSLKLMSPGGIEVNVVYKLADGHPTTSLSQVLESFDFGLLGTGYECETGTRRDLRPYLFPGMDIDGPLPLMPNKQANWAGGYISQYNGIREAGRYAKYFTYGYDLSLVKAQLVAGYEEAASYLSVHFDADKQMLGQIYEALSQHIEFDNIDELLAANASIDYKDSLDSIMEKLE